MTPAGVCTFLDTLVINYKTQLHRKMIFPQFLLKSPFLLSVLPCAAVDLDPRHQLCIEAVVLTSAKQKRLITSQGVLSDGELILV